ncbi:MAG: DUF5050 domain-containing protein [Bacillota bacterium]
MRKIFVLLAIIALLLCFAAANNDVFHSAFAETAAQSQQLTEALLSPPSASAGAFGNKAGNLLNWGLVAQYGDDVYYLNPRDNGAIYRMTAEGKQKLNGDVCHYINIVDGWVYYSSESDGWKLYRMRTDGSERAALNDLRSQDIVVVGDTAYFINGYIYENICGATYRMKTDGTGLAVITEDICLDLNIVGDTLYYANWSDNGKLYSVKTDGTEKTKINDDMCLDVNVIDGWVYYRSDIDPRGICKMRIDGSGRSLLYEGNVYCLGVLDGYIYFSNWEYEDEYPGPLYRISTDGGEAERLDSGDGCSDINLIDGWIYFYALKETNAIYRIRLDGSGRQMVD